MARNRKTQSEGLRFGAVIKAGLICAVIVFFCVGYVWQKQQINGLADQYLKRETRLKQLRDQNDKLKKQLAALTSFQALDARVKELKLGLVPPQPAQIWWLTEPSDRPAAPNSARQYAAGLEPAVGRP
jgi:hypothetical protein